jgi:ABC-type sugar transport system permease subunit
MSTVLSPRTTATAPPARRDLSERALGALLLAPAALLLLAIVVYPIGTLSVTYTQLTLPTTPYV